jgi:RHS repeat-associated protein
VQSCGYDSIRRSFQSTGIPSFGYDASAYSFTAFNPDASVENVAKLCQFTGKERDSESGLDYFGARYYGSALGRFTSTDWSDKPEPIPYADLSDPQTLNLYG